MQCLGCGAGAEVLRLQLSAAADIARWGRGGEIQVPDLGGECRAADFALQAGPGCPVPMQGQRRAPRDTTTPADAHSGGNAAASPRTTNTGCARSSPTATRTPPRCCRTANVPCWPRLPIRSLRRCTSWPSPASARPATCRTRSRRWSATASCARTRASAAKAPRGALPRPAVGNDTFNEEKQQLRHGPAFRPSGASTPAGLQALLASEIECWGDVIRAAKIEPEKRRLTARRWCCPSTIAPSLPFFVNPAAPAQKSAPDDSRLGSDTGTKACMSMVWASRLISDQPGHASAVQAVLPSQRQMAPSA